MPETLAEFFLRVTGNRILPYQERYGLDPFVPTLMSIPTGLGKTDAAIVPWLFAHSQHRMGTPTRAAIVLPRQNLTSQTTRIAREHVEKAGLNKRVRVLELMGGSSDNAETLGPDEPAILVCTQDLYLSRALNRGYARRPPRWPIDFALLNNDCFLIFDEVQLMSDGLATSTQLAAMRQAFGVLGGVPCLWMSATANPEWLDTVDFQKIRQHVREVSLSDEDLVHELVQQRYTAKKRVQRAPDECRTPKGCAAFALAQHQPGDKTLVITNTVARAREIYNDVRKKFPGAVLLHSRFRSGDRAAQLAKLEQRPAEGQIVVATQVLEAGIDITSHRVITDIAPWSSMVQRMGRANRYGELADGADIWWVDQPLRAKTGADDPAKLFAPYDPAEVDRSAVKLTTLTSGAPADLPAEDGPAPWRHVLRKADLLDLFDTSSDLSGNEVDVSRFIRSGEERDVYVAWRHWDGGLPAGDMPELRDDELCPVPISEFREFIKKHDVYRWDFTQERWERVDRDRLFPGLMVLTAASSGGYLNEEGWTPESKARVTAVASVKDRPEGDTSDPLSFGRRRQTLREHTDAVVRQMQSMLERLTAAGIVIEEQQELIRAAQLHDWGKAHDVMQETLRGGEEPGELLGKSAKNGKHSVPHFRHELASAIAMSAYGESPLAIYVAAAHHGRMRMSIRSMPGELNGRTRGISDGDKLPACEPATGVVLPEIRLSLDMVKLGTDGSGSFSWTDLALRLRDQHGPFRLAYFEMLLRAADGTASGSPKEVA